MIYQLPQEAVIGGKQYPIHCDFRDILEMISYFEDPDLPDFLKWEIALALFYEGEIPAEDCQEAMEYLQNFLTYGEAAPTEARLLDWQQDAQAIISDVNKVAGQEIRSLPFVHWWTFLSWFHGIGEGQLSYRVAIRNKLRKGQKLEPWEQDYYRENKAQIDLKPRYSAQDLAEKKRLEKLLGIAAPIKGL